MPGKCHREFYNMKQPAIVVHEMLHALVIYHKHKTGSQVVWTGPNIF